MLATVREKQFVDTTGSEADADVVAVAEAGGVIAVNLTMIRGGRHLGDRSFFPQHGEGATLAEALEAFIAQHYLEHPIPARILVSEAIETDALEALLSEQAGKKVSLLHRVTGERQVWLSMAQANARLSAERRSAERANQSQRLAALRDTLDLPAAQPHRVLRHPPHHGRSDRGLLRRLRRRRPEEIRLPPLQHQRHHAGRRLRRDARGADQALSQERRRKTACCPTCC